jgi:translocation and assembly module TamB
MRRLLLIIGSLLIVTAIVAPAVLIWSALFTASGLQFVVRHLPQQIGSMHLEISGVSGTVATGLHVERVAVDQELVHLEFEGIEGRVALAPLMLQTLRIPRARVQSALIEVKRRTHPSTPGPNAFLPAWLIISAEDAHVGSVTVRVYNGFHLEAHDILGAAVIRHSYIRLFQAEGWLEDAHLSAMGDLRAADPLGLEVKGHVDWTPSGQPGWTLYGSARGDLDALNIVAHVVSPFRADVTGQALDLTKHPHWVGDAVVQNFDLVAWGVNTPLGRISGHLAGSGDESSFSAHGAVNPTGLHVGVFEAQFTGHYADHVLTAKRMEARHVASGTRASASGTIAIVDHGPRLDLRGEWSDFRWPLVGRNIAVSSASGSFTLAGVLPYQVRLSGRGRAAQLPEMTLDARGTLGKDGVTFDPAEVDLFNGHASVSGNVMWAPAETWSVTGRATGINPGALRPEVPGSVSFALSASGRGFDTTKGSFSASFSGLSGRLRGVAASGAGTVTHSGTAWGFSNVRVALGTARLALDGSVSERVDLRFAAMTRDLSLLVAGLHGGLKGVGTVSGTLDDPAIVASAHGSDFEYQGLKLEALDADVNFNPGAATQESRIDARLRNLTYQGRTLDSVELALSGLPAAYNVRLAVTATGLALKAQATEAYAHQSFDGTLNALSINGSASLHLTLERPVSLSASLTRARVEWLCLVGTPGSICADGNWSPAAWSTTLTANQLPLETFTAGRTPAVEYRGTVTAHVQLSGGAATPLEGSLTAELAGAEILHKLASHKVEHTRVGSGTVTVSATHSAISAKADLGDGTVGTLHGTLELQRDTARWQDMPLAGELHLQTDQASLVSLYVPDIDRAAGHLGADINLAGTAGAPRLSGVVNLRDGEIDVYQINFSLRQLTLQAQLSDSGVDFKGNATCGKGDVSADGHFEWRNLLPYGRFHLQGNNLRVADVPEAQIDASPSLIFEVNGRKIEVTGRVTVPYARIQPKDITQAVRVSPDEVIVGSEPEDASRRFEVMSTITLVLGDRVNVDALGLTARLIGGVTVRNGFDPVTRGNGELSVAEGKYTAFARQLDIQRGRLIFSGGPITNPGIDVRAQKQFPDVTAGVNVRGTLQQPHISFFSEPPLTQSQIVSLLLAGGSLDSAQNATNAALGQGAAILAQQLGSRVGIPDVSLETDPMLNETSLVLGRYLSPRLYVSYGVSLTQQLNTLKLRYTLGDRWTLRAEAGQAYGADLVYSITK